MSDLRCEERHGGSLGRTVERDLEFGLVLASPHELRPVPVPTRLLYRTDDPWAVHLTFHVDSATPVEWAFARDLFVDGVFRPTGDGDVRVWPSHVENGHAVVCLALAAPDGRAVLRAPVGPVKAWLERTMFLVPPGEEALALPTAAKVPRTGRQPL